MFSLLVLTCHLGPEFLGLLGACLSRISSPAIVSEVNGVVVVQVVDGLPCDPGVVQI